jgi:hypothetical protein
MSFDPAFAEASYPDRDLRHAAFARDDTVAFAAAQRWLAGLNADSVSYQQHRMIARMILRFGPALNDAPHMVRLMGVRRQLWTRGQINLALLEAALKALRAELAFLRLVGAALWAARGGALSHDGLDVIDMIARRDQRFAIVEALERDGWQMSDWLIANFERAAVMQFSKGQTGRLRILFPRALKGITPPELFDGQIRAEQRIGLRGASMITPSDAYLFRIALACSAGRHVLADQWLFDLGNLQERAGSFPEALPEPLAEQGKAALAWARSEAGIMP